MQNLLAELTQLLSEDERLVSEGKLLKNKVIELALNMDAGLIKLLLKNESIKRHFFAETCPRVSLAGIGGVLVFDKIKFQRFVSNKQFLPDSYTTFKRYDKDGGHALSENEKIDFLKENLIIKGNNLLALHSLYKRFAGKVKLIYIDPPYNTGNDEFKYNDTFNHSTWLTFIKNRLEVAKEL